MNNDEGLSNFEATAVAAAPLEYRRFTFRDLYMHRVAGKQWKGANQAALVDSSGEPIGGFGERPHRSGMRGAMAVHNWAVYDGPGPGARLVARARGLHADTSGVAASSTTLSASCSSMEGTRTPSPSPSPTPSMHEL